MELVLVEVVLGMITGTADKNIDHSLVYPTYILAVLPLFTYLVLTAIP